MFLDPIATKKFTELAEKHKWQAIVETGTYHADSTLVFSYYAPKVFTVEIEPENYKIALSTINSKGFQVQNYTEKNCVFLKEGKFIYISLANSPEWMKEIMPILPERTLFYLDAHWGEYWPIIDELKAIKNKDCSIIIHDFQVPGKDFGYDQYKGVVLNYALVSEHLMSINPEFEIKYNEEPAGAYRGILYATPRI
jgi:hypothetical protein